MLHAVIHAVKDTLVILPILFITYLVIEFVEHKAGEKVEKVIAASGKAGPLLGGLIGLIPQCGFSGAAASLFAVGTISAGTLLAVFLATSDEMLPILISASVPAKEIVTILLIKLISGMFFGLIVDIIYKRKKADSIGHMCEAEKCHCEHDGIFLSALKHTAKIVAIVFAVTCGLNIIIELIGENNLENLVITTPVVGELTTGLIGLIPNCSASILLTDLYVENALTVGQLISGLCVNAGIGVIVLFKANKNLKENLLLTAVLYFCGIVTGILTNLIL